jgi:hypothetical protein
MAKSKKAKVGLGLIEPYDGRYGRNVKKQGIKKWDFVEDHILRAVLLSSNTNGQYVHACTFLCRTLERRPEMDIEKPSKEDISEAEVHLIRRRLWGMILSYNDYEPDAIYEAHVRDDFELNWADKDTIKLYVKSNMPKKPGLEHLAAVLGRRDTKKIDAYIKTIGKPWTGFADHQPNRGKQPRFDNALSLEIDKFKTICTAPIPVDREVLLDAWMHLFKFVRRQ